MIAAFFSERPDLSDPWLMGIVNFDSPMRVSKFQGMLTPTLEKLMPLLIPWK
jgi:hypothetical protein